MPTSCILIHTNVIDIQCPYVLQQLIVSDIDNLAECMSQNIPALIFIDEDGLAFILEEFCKFLRVLFDRVSLEQVRTNLMMNGIYLIQKGNHALNVILVGFSNHC